VQLIHDELIPAAAHRIDAGVEPGEANPDGDDLDPDRDPTTLH
jgi:hypothetical protein